MIRYYCLISGQVQGVGFRFFTQHCAVKYAITGWVRNQNDGTVELEAQGKDNNIDKFLAKIKQGPPSAKVTDYSLKETAVKDKENKFTILN